MRLPAFSLLLLAGGALGGCATASSSSFTQAPLFLSIGDEGGSQAAAVETLAPYGTRDRGVANYSVAGGNALLPVRAVAPLDAGVQANLLGTPVGLTAATGQTGPLDTNLGVNAGAVGVSAGLNGGTVTTAVGVPGNATTLTLSPNVSVGPSPLITAGPVLGNTATVVQPIAGSAAAALNATATDLSRLCVLRVCR